mgnify:CR=1 FL=1
MPTRWLLCTCRCFSGPKAPAAGSTASKLAADDAAQLKSLLAFKGYIDDSNILKGQWTASGALLQCVAVFERMCTHSTCEIRGLPRGLTDPYCSRGEGVTYPLIAAAAAANLQAPTTRTVIRSTLCDTSSRMVEGVNMTTD